MERQAKMRVDGMATLLQAGLRLAGEEFLQKQNNAERIDQLIQSFNIYFDEAVEAIGLDAPLDPPRAGPLASKYERALDPLRRWIAAPDGDGREIRRAARRDGLTALLQFVPLFNSRRSGYPYVNEVSACLSRLNERLEAGAPGELDLVQ